MNRLHHLLLLLVLTAVSACAGNDDAGAAASPPAPSPTVQTAVPTPSAANNTLVGSEWRLVALGPPDAATPAAPGSTTTLTFESPVRIFGSGACNEYSADYAMQDDTISVGQLISTERACLEQTTTAQEQRYYEALRAAESFTHTADQLTIHYDGGQGALVFEPLNPDSAESPGADLPAFPPEEPERIQFDEGETGATISASIAERDRAYYVLRAFEGQELTAEITSPNEDVLLTIVGEDGMPIKRYQNGPPAWNGALPATQDYYIEAVSVGPATTYVLTVQVREDAAQIPGDAQSYITLSQSRLAQQLRLPAEEIAVESITAPATQDGTYVVKLIAEGSIYEFHGRNGAVMQVSDPLPLAPQDVDVNVELPETVALSVTVSSVAAMTQTEEAPFWSVHPAHVELALNGYAHPATLHQPRIVVYPAAPFAGISEPAAAHIAALEALLRERPDLAGVTDTLPLLPLLNARPTVQAQPQYLSFANGSGIRYLTQYDQAANPVSSDALFYTFQGLTNDGAYYVAAIFPVAQADLPATAAESDPGYADNYQAYQAEVEAALNTAVAASFTPNLDALDSIVQSVEIVAP